MRKNMVSIDFDIIGHAPRLLQISPRKWHVFEHAQLYGTVLVSVMLAYAVALSVYRLFFHPLSKYPGPWLAAITRFYRHWHMMRGDEATLSLALHNRYGPIVRYGPDELFFIDSVAWKDIYGHRTGGKKPNRKHIVAETYPGHESLIQAKSEENHGRQRRIFSNAFSEQALRKQEPMFQKYVEMLISNLWGQIGKGPAQTFNLVDYFNYTTFDVMGDLTFSESLGMLEKSEYSPWVKTVFRAIKGHCFIYVSRQYAAIGWLVKKLLLPKLAKQRRAHYKFSEDRVDRRVEKGTEQPDIWKLVLEQQGDRVLTREEMYSNAGLFMIAGTETTATLLSGMTYHLLKKPETFKKLRAELDEAFPGGLGINSEKLARLPYLHACIQEGLRVYPPVPLAALRITPDEGAAVVGEWIPGNTKVGVPQYAAYHSATNFALPDAFWPERWLEGDDADPRFANDDKAALQPFSFGPRNCLGRNMAWFEMRLIAARMYLTFDMELCSESDDWEDQPTYILWEKKPLMVRLSKRSGVSV